MAPSYAVCGLGLQCNVALDALSGLPPPARVDVRVTLGMLPADAADGADTPDYFVDEDVDQHGVPFMAVARVAGGRYYRVAYGEGVTAIVDARGAQVWATWTGAMTVDDAASYVTGSLLGFVLRLRGICCMHGSAIAAGGKAIALVGPSGSGKSTTAAGFARLGHGVLTDDLIALRESAGVFSVEPALPRVHLWPQSAQAMVRSWESLPRVSGQWEKLRLDLVPLGYPVERAALPLGAVYFLAERSCGNAGAPIEEVHPTRALIELVSDSHATEYVGREQRAQEFEVLARLVERVPCRRVTPSQDLALIPALCRAIVRDYERIAAR